MQNAIADGSDILNPFSDSLRKRILVVEDDKTHRSIMKKILEDCECEVTSAENGLVALSKLEQGHIFDLIIMDWDMPQLNGLDTVRIIRSLHAGRKTPYIPVIAFTAKRAPGDREKCLSAGMDGYLPKDVWMPHWRQSLVDMLQGLISGNFDIHDFESDRPEKKKMPQKYNLDGFDDFALEQAADLLKDELGVAIAEYLEDAGIYISGIKEGLSAGDFRQIELNSHPLKSNSKSFGLSSVSAIAETINAQTRDSVKTKTKMLLLESLIPQLEEAFQRGSVRLRRTVLNQCDG